MTRITPAPDNRRQININISDAVHRNLGAMARRNGMSVQAYADALFQAAYATRCKDTGDAELQDVVGATLVLHGQRQDTATIAKVLRIGEADVVRIIETWRARDRRAG